jgi:hypothetical protein
MSVKKLIAILFMVTIVVTASKASAARWFLGTLGGVNIADLTDVDETSMRTGFSGGGFVGADFSESLTGRVEFLYTQKGAQRNQNPEFGGDDTTAKLDYVEFPILLVLDLNSSPTSEFSVIGGPSFGYNLVAEEELEDGSVADYADYVNKFEASLVLGAEFEHIEQSLSIFLDTRITIGLTGILDNLGSELDGVKNIGFGVLVGVKFPLGAKQ